MHTAFHAVRACPSSSFHLLFTPTCPLLPLYSPLLHLFSTPLRLIFTSSLLPTVSSSLLQTRYQSFLPCCCRHIQHTSSKADEIDDATNSAMCFARNQVCATGDELHSDSYRMNTVPFSCRSSQSVETADRHYLKEAREAAG